MVPTFDFVVLGSGIAGLTFARKVAEMGSVAIVTKRGRAESNTNWAQGGIAGVLAPDDSEALHIEDTLVAGAGLCRADAVRTLVHEGPDRIRELIAIGTRFDREPGTSGNDLALAKEGGHSRRRIAYSRDLTGREIERALLSDLDAHPSVTLFEHHIGIDFARGRDGGSTVRGVHVLDASAGDIHSFRARRCVLVATGGCGQVYLHTTNPSIATGDGIAMAFRAGARIEDMEFIQFHPTTLFHPAAESFLISEAVRGEGGVLRDLSGRAFMDEYDSRGNLAPRDIVARAIDTEMKKSGAPCMFLDIRHLPAGEVRHRFPNIYARCLSFGIDMVKEMVPVVPAAHYACGGVATDLEGRSTLPRLRASGEAACTGVHGANRLASNSLLEGLVFSHRACEALRSGDDPPEEVDIAPFEAYRGRVRRAQTEGLRLRIRTIMTKFVGIFRTVERLEQARAALDIIAAEITGLYDTCRPTEDLLELRNLCIVAQLIVAGALERRESRGLHAVEDWPDAVEAEDRHIGLARSPDGRIEVVCQRT